MTVEDRNPGSPDVQAEPIKPVRPLVDTLIVVSGYAISAALWIVLSDRVLFALVSGSRAAVLSSEKGALFVVVTSLVLFSVIYRYLSRLRASEARFMQAQAEIREKELAVRQGYVDVLDAVTGGKLILATRSELVGWLGEPMMESHALTSPSELAEARRTIANAVSDSAVTDLDSLILACSEALTNAVKHGGRGEYALYMSGECLQVLVRDYGPGIDFRALPKATLIQGFSTTSTMGLGFTIMLEVCDRVVLATDSHGTMVLLELSLAPAPSSDSSQAQALFGP